MQMHSHSLVRWTRIVWTALVLAVLAPSLASAALYNFTSGFVELRATLDDGSNTDVLQPGTSPVEVLLGGSFAELDPGVGPNGAIVDLKLVPDADFLLDLDETVVGHDLIQVSGAMLVEALGAQGLLDGSGGFFLDTEMSAIVTGIGGPPPPTPVLSLTSAASGSAVVVGGDLYLGLIGVNLATFPSLTGGPDINVKADFQFVGTLVPEPGTALLLGLGLAGLASRRRARA